jgi:hypothetical protein
MESLRHVPYNLSTQEQEVINNKLNEYYPREAYQYVVDNELKKSSMTNTIHFKMDDSLGMSNNIPILLYVAIKERIVVYRRK